MLKLIEKNIKNMRYIKKLSLNESEETLRETSEELDWDLIKDSMIDSFDNVDVINSFVKFHFYVITTERDANGKTHMYYDTYVVSKTVDLVLDLDPNLLKKENRFSHLRGRWSKGSSLYGVELDLYIGKFDEQYKVINNISDLSKATKYFKNCSDLIADCEATIKRVNDKYDYKISFKNKLIKYEESGYRRGEFDQGYSMNLRFFDSKIIDAINTSEPDFYLKDENWIK